MLIEVNYKEAVTMFLNHLANSNMKKSLIKSFEKTLQGNLKRLIARELKIYALNLSKIKSLQVYSKQRQYEFASALRRFNSLLDEKYTHFGQAFDHIQESLSQLTSNTIAVTKHYIMKMITLDIDDLNVSQIPKKLIQGAMNSPSPFTLTRARRFFKFLIHTKMLDNKYLPIHKNKIFTFMENAPDSFQHHMNIEQGVAIFIKSLYQNKKLHYSAIKANYYYLKRFSKFIGIKKKIKYITSENVICYFNYLEHKRGYSHVSRASALVILRRFFRYCAAQKVINMDPTVNIHIKRTKKIVKAVLNEQELTLIFKGAYLLYQKYEDRKPKDGKTALYKWLAARDWAIISLLICTGIRRKEIMSIDIESIDLQNRVIKIQGKGDLIHHIRERIIPITEPVVLASLETYIKLRPKSLFPELFLSARFEPLLANGFECVVKKIMSEILPGKSLNITKIRRSYICLCAEKGVDPMVLKQIMGHHSLATTMKYYLTVREQYLKDVWEKNNPLNYFTNEECEKWII